MGLWLANTRIPNLDCVGCAKPTKCCAFQPFIPNYLIGAWLESPKGAMWRASIRSPHNHLPTLRNAHWHPLGLIPALSYRQEHARAGGSNPDLACEFFENRMCSLYAFRPAECRTYFCEGDDHVSASQIAHAKENALAQMALVECGFGAREIAEQIDLLNAGACADYTGNDLVFMYKKAWNWSQQITEQTVDAWIS